MAEGRFLNLDLFRLYSMQYLKSNEEVPGLSILELGSRDIIVNSFRCDLCVRIQKFEPKNLQHGDGDHNELELVRRRSAVDAQKILSDSMIHLIDMTLKDNNAQKLHEQADITAKLYTPSAERKASTYRFLLGDTKSSSSPTTSFLSINQRPNNEYLVRLLNAIETISASLMRQRRIIRLDGTNSLIRCFVFYLTESEHCSTVDVLCSLLIMLYVQDKKFCLKVRLGGLITLFHKKLLLLAKDRAMLSVLQLCCCCIRSVRSARVFGKSEKFVKGLITIIVNGTDAAISARLMEILYLIIKFRSRPVMNVLEANDIFPVLIRIFEEHLRHRPVAQTHLEICLFAVASLRNFSRLKRNRDRIGAIGAMETFYSAVSIICSDREYLDCDPLLVPSVSTLQESLYALCMSCLPIRAFPISAFTPPPVSFPLPGAGNPDQQPAWSPAKVLRNNFLCISPIQQHEATMSSDEDGGDDEDEALFSVEPYGGDDDEDTDTVLRDSHLSLRDPPLKLPIARLTTDYSQYFTEFTQGTASAVGLSVAKTIPGKLGTVKFADILEKVAKETKSASNFVKIAYPATVFPTDLRSFLQPLARSDLKRDLLVNEIAHLREESNFTPRVVFDLDHLLSSKNQMLTSWKTFSIDDPNRIGKMSSRDHLLFESRFEGGNLRRAIQVSKWRYQLILSPDINQLRPHYQWFYFEVSSNEAGVDYTFEIINCIKKTSMFNRGMQPVLFSVTDACRGKPGWVRAGSAICYYRNTFFNNESEKAGNTASVTRYYFSLRFTIRFEHRADICYIAYHFPYTYSTVQATLERHTLRSDREGLYFRNDKLCTSLAGNVVSLLTITADGNKEELTDRQIILLCARVHPGESNSSWIMHGIMDYLMSDQREAVQLRDQFVFKLIPMLNVDGVVNGCHRCSLAGVDLNRTWDQPSPTLHPVVYHTKALVQYMVNVLGKKPFVFVDLHGHSKRFNVFIFGNNPDESWRIVDHSLPGTDDFMSLPSLLQQKCDYFSLSNCRFNITKVKESSGRVTLWRQFGVTRSYTMESTYCGFDAGPLQGYQVNIGHLLDMGKQLCVVFNHLKHYGPPTEKKNEDSDSE